MIARNRISFALMVVAFWLVVSLPAHAGLALRNLKPSNDPTIITQGVVTTVAQRAGAANESRYSMAVNIGTATIGGIVEGAVTGGWGGAIVGGLLAAAGVAYSVLNDPTTGEPVIAQGTYPAPQCYVGGSLQTVTDFSDCVSRNEAHIMTLNTAPDSIDGISHSLNWEQDDGDWHKQSIKFTWTDGNYGTERTDYEVFETWIGDPTGIEPVSTAQISSDLAPTAHDHVSDYQELLTDSNGEFRPGMAEVAVPEASQTLTNLPAADQPLPSNVVETPVDTVPTVDEIIAAGGGTDPDTDPDSGSEPQQIEFPDQMDVTVLNHQEIADSVAESLKYEGDIAEPDQAEYDDLTQRKADAQQSFRDFIIGLKEDAQSRIGITAGAGACQDVTIPVIDAPLGLCDQRMLDLMTLFRFLIMLTASVTAFRILMGGN